MSDDLRDTTTLPLNTADVARIWRKVYGGTQADCSAFEFADAIMRAALAAAQPPAAMPVPLTDREIDHLAWHHFVTDLSGRSALEPHADMRPAVRKLVRAAIAAAPAAQPVPATGAQPLTEEQIVMDAIMMMPNSIAKDCAKACEYGIRYAEKHYGIVASTTAPTGSAG